METFYANTDIENSSAVKIDDLNEIIHAYASLRIKPGEKVELINGKGKKFLSEVLECSKRSFVLMPLEEIVQDSEYETVKLSLAISLLNKNSKMKLLAEKLTEIGVSEIIPFTSERTAFPKMKTESLRPSMISALKQCGGKRDVIISGTVTFSSLAAADGYDEKYFADINGETINEPQTQGKVLLAVGPEGGLTENEIEELTRSGFKPVKLNKRILRAETAAIAGASKFLY
jgi:16S rRNA (uracil1498-N3)-methyltransferase